MISITIFQLIFASIAFGFWLNALLKFFRRERSQTFFKFFTNSIIWLGVMVFALYPKVTHILSVKLGFGDSLNTLIFIGFLFVFMILFKIITMIERVEKNISEIVRDETLSPLRNIQKNDQ
jgi:hypothetical protein